MGLVVGLIQGMVLGSVFGLIGGLVETRSLLITSHTLKETSTRSLLAALLWLYAGLIGGLLSGLGVGLLAGSRLIMWLFLGPFFGLVVGPSLGIRNSGGFVLLQKVAHRRLSKRGNLPPRPADFLEWGIEIQVFHRVGSGVRFRHSLIQQHLANT